MLTSWSCAVVLLLEFDSHFLHSTSHTCSPFDVGVLTHVPPPPPLVHICNFKFSSVLRLCDLHPQHPTLDKKLSPLLHGSLEAISFPNTNSKQIKRKIKLNWGGLASSDSRECLECKEEKDQIAHCQLCLRRAIFKSYQTSQVLGEIQCYGIQHAVGREEDYNKQRGKLFTN